LESQMPCRSIVLAVSGDDATAIDSAAAFAAQFGAELRVTPAFPDVAADYLAYGAALKHGAKEVATEAARASERDAQSRIDSLAERSRRATAGSRFGQSRGSR
jgi:hypothetical protein